jgi:hypothetical protein
MAHYRKNVNCPEWRLDLLEIKSRVALRQPGRIIQGSPLVPSGLLRRGEIVFGQ